MEEKAMLDLTKSYEENVSKKEYTHYGDMISLLIETGDIKKTHKMLMDTKDISNIVSLALLKWKNCMDRGAGTNIGKLYSNLDHKTRMDILRGFGLQFIISTGLDEIKAFTDTISEEAERLDLKLRTAEQKKAFAHIQSTMEILIIIGMQKISTSACRVIIATPR